MTLAKPQIVDGDSLLSTLASCGRKANSSVRSRKMDLLNDGCVARRRASWDITCPSILNMYVWTLIEEDNAQLFWAGVHFVNRIGYVLTALRADDPCFDSIRWEDGTVMVKYFEYVYDENGDMVDVI